MSPHQERVILEKNELDAKISSLSRFTGTDIFLTLSTIDKSLLFKQLAVMHRYSLVLKMRINLFEDIPF